MGADSVEELFEMLDDDDSGEVTITELFEALTKHVSSNQPAALIPIRKKLQICRITANSISSSINGLNATVHQLKERQDEDEERLKRMEEALVRIAAKKNISD